MKKISAVIFSLVLGGTVSISGCSTTSDAEEPIRYPAQIIIKFTSRISDPSDQEFVESLSQDIGISLIYLRAMSGGAQVFRVKGPCSEKQLSLALQRLTARDDVVYAEQDRVMRHQSSFH